LSSSIRFSQQANALGLTRVVVITTEATASASEMVVNSLRPYIEVVTVGSTTSGKPYSSIASSYCGNTLSAMHSIIVNAEGVSVGDGITADCYGEDDLTRDFGIRPAGEAFEGLARSAAAYIVSGDCAVAPVLKQTAPADIPMVSDELPGGAEGY